MSLFQNAIARTLVVLATTVAVLWGPHATAASVPLQSESPKLVARNAVTWTLSVPARRWSTPITFRSADYCTTPTVWGGPAPDRAREGDPLWLVGHNYCGYQFWTHLPESRVVRFTSSSGDVVRFRVDGHAYVDRRGGPAAGLIRGALTLQTCLGRGTSFTYASRI